MELYYIQNEEKVGPCTADMLRQAEKDGHLTGDTLAWHDSLEEWQPWAKVKEMAHVASFLDSGVLCAVCSQPFNRDEVVEFGGDIVCSGCKNTYVQRLKEGVDAPANALGMWRKKKVLIVTPHSEFPDRCVKCNEPANGFRKKLQLIYHPPYVIILFLLIGIFALLLGKKHKVEIGLCPQCRKKRMTGILLGVASVCLFFGGCAGGIGLSGKMPGISASMMIGGMVLGVIVAIIATITSSLVRAQYIGADCIKISGAGEKFLDSLPDYD